MAFNEKKFWKIAHKAICKNPTKEQFIAKMQKYQSMVPGWRVPGQPDDPTFFPYVMGQAYRTWFDGTPFGAWKPYRKEQSNG